MNDRYCPQCGTEMAAGASFCSNCGAQIEARSATRQRKAPGRGKSTATRVPLPLAILALGGLLLIAAAVLLANNQGDAPTTAANPPENPTAETVTNPNAPFPDVPRISLSQAKTLYDSDQAIFIDVRTEENYRSAHIPDARLIPLTSSGLDAAYRTLPQDVTLITYCT